MTNRAEWKSRILTAARDAKLAAIAAAKHADALMRVGAGRGQDGRAPPQGAPHASRGEPRAEVGGEGRADRRRICGRGGGRPRNAVPEGTARVAPSVITRSDKGCTMT